MSFVISGCNDCLKSPLIKKLVMKTTKEKMKDQINASYSENRNYEEFIVNDAVVSGRFSDKSEARETLEDMKNCEDVVIDPITKEVSLKSQN